MLLKNYIFKILFQVLLLITALFEFTYVLKKYAVKCETFSQFKYNPKIV